MKGDLLVIDGFNMPSVVDYEVSINDLDSEGSGRNELGVNQRDRIREGVRKIQVSGVQLSESEVALILQATKKAEFNVTYLDPEVGVTTKSMYAGPKNTKLVYNSWSEERWNINFNLVEN